LLGVAPDEADAEVIAEAALRQTSHVRSYQTGPHGERCTALLNEIAQARATLLNPGRRKEYDRRLAEARPAEPDAAPAPAPAPVGDVELVPLTERAAPDLGRWAHAARRTGASAAPLALAYLALLVLGGFLAFRLTGAGQPPRDRPAASAQPTKGKAAAARPSSAKGGGE
jgi:hypothetical protein